MTNNLNNIYFIEQKNIILISTLFLKYEKKSSLTM